MSDYDFVIPKRYDTKLAEDGYWFQPVDELGQHYGKFKLALYDETSTGYMAAVQRLQRKYASRRGQVNEAVQGKSNDDWAVEIFIEVSLKDWEIKSGKGKAIPFSPETAFAYFSRPDALWLFKELVEIARDVKNFQPEEQEELPEGNS